MIFKLFVINQLQILFFFKSLFSVTFWCHFWRYHRFWWNFLMNTKNEDFFSKLSKFFDIFLVSVFNWELFWFSSNSLKKIRKSRQIFIEKVRFDWFLATKWQFWKWCSQLITNTKKVLFGPLFGFWTLCLSIWTYCLGSSYSDLYLLAGSLDLYSQTWTFGCAILDLNIWTYLDLCYL